MNTSDNTSSTLQATQDVLDNRAKWKFRGQRRPSFADEITQPNQESVWDYPRPPAIVPDHRLVTVQSFNPSSPAIMIAQTQQAVRICETAGPPVFYIPPKDVNWSALQQVPGTSRCEWKGQARYWGLKNPVIVNDNSGIVVAWDYPQTFPEYASIQKYISFYPGRLICRVDGERVRPHPGEFYGGWMTNEIVGPIKGESGSEWW